MLLRAHCVLQCPYQKHANRIESCSLVVHNPIQSLHPQVCKKPVVSLALPGLVIMSTTRPVILWVCSLRASMIDDRENCLDLVRTSLLQLAWPD